jgi:pyrroline-5-carboxylate reductase
MAEALLKGILEAGLYVPRDIWVSDVRPERLDQLKKQYKIKVTPDKRELVSKSEMIVLSVKPQQMASVLENIAGTVKEGTVVISIAAGIRTEKIKAALAGTQVIRVMPNTPAMVGAGASGLYNAGASKDAMKKAVEIFSSVGRAIAVDEEDLIDAVTAVSGSGPAYFFLLMEQMIEAGVKLGVSPEAAKTLVLQTAKGAALLAEQADQKGENPADLRKKVTSPGGTTEAAIKVFSDRSFGEIVLQALQAANQRSRQLSK